MLAEGPASGYDLARRFQDVLGPVWPAQHPKIYAELGRLTADDMIEVDSLGPRGRKANRITETGLTEVQRWLTEGDVDHTVRIESLLRFYFLLAEPHTVVGRIRWSYERDRGAGHRGDAPALLDRRTCRTGCARTGGPAPL